MNRVLVVGSTGSGKTSFAGALARRLETTHIELDALWWRPGWVESPHDEFRVAVAEATSGPRWVTDGNYYSVLGDLLWQRADVMIWLDMPLPLILARIVRRTIARSLRKTDLWGTGNTEKISTLWAHDSLIRWAIKVRDGHRKRYGGAMSDVRYGNVRMVRLRSPRAVRRFLTEASARPR